MMKLVFEGNPTYKVDKKNGVTECTMRGHVKLTHNNKTRNFPSFEVTTRAALQEGDTWDEEYGRWLSASKAIQKMYHKAKIDMNTIREDLMKRFDAILEMNFQLEYFIYTMEEYEKAERKNQLNIETRIENTNERVL